MPGTYSKRNLPPCPDPDKYILAKMGKEFYWRRKRGTVKPAVLNKSLRTNADCCGVINLAANEIFHKLEPFLDKLITGRSTAKIGGKLKRGLNATNCLDYTFLNGYEFQEDYLMKTMLKPQFEFSVSNGMAGISIVLNEWSVKALNRLVTQYSIEIILLHGELLSEHGLRIETDASRWYNFDESFKEQLELSILLPENLPWMLILKVSCMEGKERALHPKHHLLRVIGTGRDRREQKVRLSF